MSSGFPFSSPVRARYLLLLVAILASLVVADLAAAEPEETLPHATETLVFCDSPSGVGVPSKCTVEVFDGSGSDRVTPRGTITFSTAGNGTFSNGGACSLLVVFQGRSRCQLTYTPKDFGPGKLHRITAVYPGQEGTETRPPLEGSEGEAEISTLVADPTATTLRCEPGVVTPGRPSTCTATLRDAAGTPSLASTRRTRIFFSSTGLGSFSAKSCPVKFDGERVAETITCSVTYTSLRASAAPTTITAAYEGDEAHFASQGSTPVRDPNTVTVLSCDPPSVVTGHGATCTVMVEDPSATPQAPTGTVDLTTSGPGAFDGGARCTLGFSTGRRAFCQVTYTPSGVGTASHELTAVYRGDAGHDPSEDVTQVGVLSGVIRYAAPGGTGFDPCDEPARPCPLERAADENSPESTLGAGDEIVMAPGTYSGDHDLGPERTISLPDGVFLHGTAGQPLPVIDQQSSGSSGAILVGANDRLSRFEIRSDALHALSFRGDGAIAEGLIVRSSGSFKAIACDTGGVTKLIIRDSACLATGPGSTALGLAAGLSRDLTTVRVRNMTAISTGTGSAGLAARVDSGREVSTLFLDGVGVIAKGTAKDAIAEAGAIGDNPGARIEIQLRKSDYATTEVLESDGGVATVTPAGTSGNIVEAPLLAADQVHQRLGSPTIDGGATDSFSGAADVDGGRRVQGRTADIGADEFAPNSTATLSCDPTTVKAGDATTCTATVIDERGNPSPPGGTVRFSTDSAGEFSNGGACTLETVPGRQASCQLTYETGAAGPHGITAIYQGGTHEPSQASATVLAIDKSPTETELSCVPASVEAGRAAHCAVTVTDLAQSEPTPPTGTVSFSSNGSGDFSAPDCELVQSGPDSAVCEVDYTPSAVGSGAHDLEAAYGSDQTHAASTGAFGLTVTREGGGGGDLNPTETTLLCVPGSVDLGHDTHCTATVRDTAPSGATTPTGTVEFTSNGAGTFGAGSCTLNPGAGNQASCEVTYTPTAVGSGSHEIAADYRGDATHLLSGDTASIAVSRQRSATVTILVCAPRSIEPGDLTHCTATVQDTTPGGGTVPSGNVTFESDSPGDFSPAQCTLVAGPVSASCAVDYVPSVVQSGIHRLRATFAGSGLHSPSSRDFDVTVSEEAPGGGDKAHTVTTLLCVPGSAEVGHRSRCVATVRDTTQVNPSAPTGTVTFDSDSTGSFSASQCTLAQVGPDRSRCLVDYTPGAVRSGTHSLEATYSSDQTHASSADSFDLTAIAVGADDLDSTTTTLECLPATVSEGERSVCAATVTDVDADPSAPTGTVEFEHANAGFFSPAPSCELVQAGPDSATCDLAYVPAASGAHGILSLYTGDDGHDASVAVAAISVIPREGGTNPTSTTVECLPGSVEVEVASTCEVTVEDTSATPSTPTGTVSFASSGQGGFSDGGSCTLASQAVAPPIGEPTASCQVTYTPTARGTGSHGITAVYPGDASHEFSLAQFDLTVTEDQHRTRTALNCEPGGVEVGQPSTCTVSVVDASTTPTVPTGSVELSSNAEGEFANGGTCALSRASQNSAFCRVEYRPTSVPPSETHELLAEYLGDATHRRSQGTDAIVVVPSQSRTQVACDPAQLTEGETTTCTATVFTGNAGNPNPIEGNVEFRTSGRGSFEPATTCTLSGDNQSASCSVRYTSDRAGKDTIQAISSGDDTHQGSSGSTEVTFTKHATTTALSCEPGGVEIGQASTCTATVLDTSADPSAPGGSVELDSNEEGNFANGGTCALSPEGQDTASCTVDYTPSAVPVSQTHTVHAEYSGDDTHEPSEGGDQIHVDRSLTRTQVACGPDEATKGDTVTCTVTVSLRNAGNPRAIGGDVRFANSLRGTFLPDRICTLNGNAQSASCSVDFRTEEAGHHLIEASYSGDDSHLVSNDVTAIDVTEGGGGGDKNATSAELICQSPVQSGTATTCAVSVEDTGADPSAPTGTVSFDTDSDGAFAAPGTCDLAPAAADISTCQIAYTPAGPAATHALEADYPGDDDHTGDTDSFDLTVTAQGGGGGQHSTAAELQCTSPARSGTATTCTATVEDTATTGATAPAGTVVFDSDHPGTFEAPGTCQLTPLVGPAAGNASACELDYTPSGPAATHNLEIDYPGDETHTGDLATFELSVTEAGGGGGENPTATALDCNPTTVILGGGSVCTVVVEDTAETGASAPSGLVDFQTDGAGDFANTCTLAPIGQARARCQTIYNPTAVGDGIHEITATYGGEAGHEFSADSVDLTVTGPNGGHDTATTLECEPANVILGGVSICTVTVKDRGGEQTVPGGGVVFGSDSAGDFSSGGCLLFASGRGEARCQLIYKPSQAGVHQITAIYPGDAGHEPSQSTELINASPPNGGHRTRTALECDPESVAVGSETTCTATVTDIEPDPTRPARAVVFASDGPGSFSVGGCHLGVSPAGEAEASCSFTYTPSALGSGTHRISAAYEGDNGHEPSPLVSDDVTVTPVLTPPGPPLRQTTTSLACAPASVLLGAATTCTATVADTTPGPSVAGGTVNFASDGQGAFSASGACTLAPAGAGKASCQVTYTPSALGTGAHKITATYPGNATHQGSQGTAQLQVTGPTPTAAPNTIIKKKPRKKGAKRKAKFKFVSDQPGSIFQCKLDRKPFKPCRSPFKKKVKPGRHIFKVRAVNAQGIADPTPAVFKWKVRGV
jgi:large repetitive protein